MGMFDDLLVDSDSKPSQVSSEDSGGVINIDALPQGLKPYAKDFESAGQKYGIDPNFLAAISWNETGGGTSKAFRQGNNAMGISNASGPLYGFNSVADSIERQAATLARPTGPYSKASTIQEVGNIYSPVGAENDPYHQNSDWTGNVGNFYDKLTGKGNNAIVLGNRYNQPEPQIQRGGMFDDLLQAAQSGSSEQQGQTINLPQQPQSQPSSTPQTGGLSFAPGSYNLPPMGGATIAQPAPTPEQAPELPWYDRLRNEFEASAAKGTINTIGGVLRAASAIPIPAISEPARQGAELMSAAIPEAEQIYGANPKDTSAAAGIGRGLGNMFAMAPAMFAGPAALPTMALQGGGQAYAETYDNTVNQLKQEGVTNAQQIDDQSHRAASIAAVKTVPELGAYLVGGKLTSAAVGSLLKEASPLIKGLAGGTAAAGVNMATSAGIRGIEGQPLRPTAESLTQDIAFGAFHGIGEGMKPSSNPVVNQKEAQINSAANAQAEVPLTPEQQKMRNDLEKRGNQWEELRQQLVEIANQAQNLPEDHPDRAVLRDKASKISQQMADLRDGKPVDIQPREPQGDERFKPKPENAVQVETTGEVGVRNAPAVGEGMGEQNKPEEVATQGETPQEEVGGQGEPIQTTEAELRSAYPNTAFFDEANEALQRLNQEDARGNNRQRFHLPTLQDLRQLNPAYKLADKLAGIFGKKVVLYKGEEGTYINGATSSDPALKDYIFLKVDGQRPHLFTAGHELWHHIELNSPLLANSLRNQISPLIKDWAGLRGKYKSAGYNESRFFDEHIADFLGDAMQDPKFWNKLAEKNPKTFKELATQTVDWLNKLLYQLKDWRMGGDYTRDIEKARDMLADGLSKFAEGKDEPVSLKGESVEETNKKIEDKQIFDPPSTPTLVDNRNAPELVAKKGNSLQISGGSKEGDILDPVKSKRIFDKIGYSRQEIQLPEDFNQRVTNIYGKSISNIKSLSSLIWSGAHFKGGIAIDPALKGTQRGRVIAHEQGHASHSLLADNINKNPTVLAELPKIEEMLYPNLRDTVKSASNPDVKFFNYLLSPEELIAEFNVERIANPEKAKQVAPELSSLLESVEKDPNLVADRKVFPTSRFGVDESNIRLKVADLNPRSKEPAYPIRTTKRIKDFIYNVSHDNKYNSVYEVKSLRENGVSDKTIKKIIEDHATDNVLDYLKEKHPDLFEEPSKTEEGKGPMFQQDEEKRNRDFYSQLQRTITDKMPNKASVEQIRAIIDPAKGSGVKPEELKWSNLDNFLEGKKSVTKDEILNYLKNEGAVKFEERTLGENQKSISTLRKERDAIKEKRHNVSNDINKLAQNWRDSLKGSQEESDRLWKEMEDKKKEFYDLDGKFISLTQEISASRPTKYSQYTLPNGENYREVVLTMPLTDKSDPIASYKKLPNGSFEVKFIDGADGTYPTLEEARIDGRGEGDVQGVSEYRSSHFSDIPNYVAHMRLDERPDSEGHNGLFIEEIQSDRHQQGRERGYAGENESEIPQGYQLRDLNEEARQQGFNIPQDSPQRWKFSTNDYVSRQYSSREEALEALKKHATNVPKGIPDAPFRKDWPVQMFKRALRDAIASGKEWIGWTKGDTQAERYDLSKQVEAILPTKNADGTYTLDALKKDSRDGVISVAKNIDESKLADYVGKDIAKQIIEAKLEVGEDMEIAGEDLKVGGEGMKGFYDQILPKEIGKYVKKWGAKVEEGEVGGDTYRETEDGSSGWATTPIWKVKITPEMRESVTKEGQPMFQQDRPTEQEASKKREEIETRFQAAPIRKTKNTIVNTFKRKPAQEAISYMRDAGDNAANIYAKQNSNEIANDLKREFKSHKDKAAEALSFVIEAKGDQNELANMRQKIANSPDASKNWKKKALDAIDFADTNFSRFDPIAKKYEQIGLHQVAQENANGIDTPVREGYVPHYQDLEEQELFGGAGTGSATGFRKMRTFDTFADSIANGIDPKSLNAVDLLQKRLSSGQKSINYRSWIDSLKQTIDPASGDPIATKVSIVKRPDGSSYIDVPRGYHQETLAGQRVAIKDGYEGIMSALNDPSAWSKSMVAKTIQKTAGAGKSITLGLDTYHLGRIAIWNSLIKSLGLSTFKLPIPSYRKGATLLDQTLPELQKMIANGEIPRSYARGILENKRLLNLAVKTGYNVGGISDSLHQDWIHKIPALGDFNSWLFNQFQRGAMAESWLLEFQRYRNAYPTLPEADVARMVSKDLNTRYGNLGRQGLLKSKTMQDTARMLFLAPQWNEGLIRTELGALGQTGKALLDAATGKRMFAGVLARSVGGMMAAQFIANQLINYATRGTPTWENAEEGIGAKLSAWIPDLWGGPGFFLNPMSLAMETTHLLMKGYERTGDAKQTVLDYLRSRSSVPMRPVWDAVTNKNMLGTPYAPGQAWKGMLADAMPMPIAGGTISSAIKEAMTGEPNQQYAGQYQKQLFSTFGVKLEQAPSDESRIYTLANHYKLDNNIQDRMSGYSSPYSELNHALIIGNITNAKNAMTKILETRSPAQVEKYYKDTYPSMRLLESKIQQKDFLDSLNEEQRGVYERAKDKRKDTSASALDLLREMR